MLFKQFSLFQLTEALDWSLTTWEERLAGLALKPCGQYEAQTHGFASPLTDETTQLAMAHGQYVMFALKNEYKVLPPSVVREEAERKFKEAKQESGRNLGAQEKRSIRDEVTFSLLPKAFVQSKKAFAIVDKQNQWVLLSATTPHEVKTFIQFSQKLFGPKVLQPYPAPQNLQRLMTSWLLEGPEAPFECGQACQLFDPKRTSRVIACRNCELQSTPILNHLEQGYWVSKLGLVWQDHLSFQLESDFTFKQVKFHDQAREAYEEVTTGQDQAEQDHVDFMITADTLSAMLKDILPQLVGANYTQPQAEVMA